MADMLLLRSPEGEAALAEARRRMPTESDRLSALQSLRKRFPPGLSAAAVEMVLLRARAKAKWTDADKLFLTREALEQATGEVVATYRARRLARFPTVLDLGCGLGADSIAIARAGPTVIGIDSDEIRATLARWNREACGVPGPVLHDDGLAAILPAVDAVFCDPARRLDGRRVIAPEDSLPAPSAVIARFPPGFPIGFKLAPGVHRDDAARYGGEVEFISLDGELKESVVWLGPLKSTSWRATLLRSEADDVTLTAEGTPDPAPVGEVGEFLYDPDPAVVRADLTGILARETGLHALDHRVATLTGPMVDTPFATRFRILGSCDLDSKKVAALLREFNVGPVTIIKRGVDVDTEPLLKKWKGDGPNVITVFLTPVMGRPRAIVLEREMV